MALTDLQPHARGHSRERRRPRGTSDHRDQRAERGGHASREDRPHPLQCGGGGRSGGWGGGVPGGPRPRACAAPHGPSRQRPLWFKTLLDKQNRQTQARGHPLPSGIRERLLETGFTLSCVICSPFLLNSQPHYCGFPPGPPEFCPFFQLMSPHLLGHGSLRLTSDRWTRPPGAAPGSSLLQVAMAVPGPAS